MTREFYDETSATSDVSVPLDNAREVGEEYAYGGDFLYVTPRTTGFARIAVISDAANFFVDAYPDVRIYGVPFRKIKVVNPAQPSKSLQMVIGKTLRVSPGVAERSSPVESFAQDCAVAFGGAAETVVALVAPSAGYERFSRKIRLFAHGRFTVPVADPANSIPTLYVAGTAILTPRAFHGPVSHFLNGANIDYVVSLSCVADYLGSGQIIVSARSPAGISNATGALRLITEYHG